MLPVEVADHSLVICSGFLSPTTSSASCLSSTSPLVSWTVSPQTDTSSTGTKQTCTTGFQVSAILSMRVKLEVPLCSSLVWLLCLLSGLSEHKIQGDSLCDLDADGLKSLGIATIGQRLAILKHIYQVKLAHSVPIYDYHYVPPCELHITAYFHVSCS